MTVRAVGRAKSPADSDLAHKKTLQDDPRIISTWLRNSGHSLFHVSMSRLLLRWSGVTLPCFSRTMLNREVARNAGNYESRNPSLKPSLGDSERESLESVDCWSDSSFRYGRAKASKNRWLTPQLAHLFLQFGGLVRFHADVSWSFFHEGRENLRTPKKIASAENALSSRTIPPLRHFLGGGSRENGTHPRPLLRLNTPGRHGGA